MIHDRYPKEPSGGHGIPGSAAVVGRRLGVAGRVVVAEEGAGGVRRRASVNGSLIRSEVPATLP